MTKEEIEKAIVKPNGGNFANNHFYFRMNDVAKKKCKEKTWWHLNEFLANKLEEYLNGTK